jgi:hypothetical protein
MKTEEQSEANPYVGVTTEYLQPEQEPANRYQVGGEHYRLIPGTCPNCGEEVQHWDLYARAPYLEGQITKYVTRWQKKNGVEDLLKARHYLAKLIEWAQQKNTPARLPVKPLAAAEGVGAQKGGNAATSQATMKEDYEKGRWEPGQLPSEQ